MKDELPQEYRIGGFFTVLVVIALMAIGFALLLRTAMQPHVSKQLGKPFPPIEAASWINGNAPTADELKGQILVVDAWAFWCGPCRSAVPSLIELHEKFKDRVKFIGLTSEGFDADSLKKSHQFVERAGIHWLNGFAAMKPLRALDVEGIPQLWVVNGQNQIVYHEEGWDVDKSPRDVEQAIIKAIGSQ